jgi:glycosyltransferase involved in cell wall biosynthesis
MHRILLITSVLPWPLRTNGGAQRTELLRRALSRHGHVDIVGVGGAELRNPSTTVDELVAANVVRCFEVPDPPIKPSLLLPGRFGGLARLLAQVHNRYAPNPELVEWVAEAHKVRSYKLIVSRYLAPALQARVGRLGHVPLVLDLDDVDWQTIASSVQANPWSGINGKIGSFLVLRQVEAICKHSLDMFQHIWVTNEHDRKLLKHQHCSVLPNIPFTDVAGSQELTVPPADSSLQLLFVGDLQFPPNRDGLTRFIRNVWPHVYGSVSNATVTIIGRGLREQDRSEWSTVPGINVVGFVADLQKFYASCAFTIVPVYFGGGTKIKILESLFYGRTCVTTQQSLRGMEALLGTSPSLIATDDDNQFAQACVTLLLQPQLRTSLAERGKHVIARQFSFARFSAIVEETVAPLL